MEKSVNMANYILAKFKEDGININIVKLNNLLYLANLLYKHKYGKVLFNDGIIEKDIGFIITRVYERYRSFKFGEIVRFDEPILKEISYQEKLMLDTIIYKFRDTNMSGIINYVKSIKNYNFEDRK